ncbi:10060_t:CDS:2 [Diversispora eburnea]|uniref:10060_t:CDS:1 n=1 Tax=Diversispora eburnea TaxID=1213867 RepID=A0A9N9BC75_9GLOM|nr:10060_t:CDS:2 [Diversispora eburnea]
MFIEEIQIRCIPGSIKITESYVKLAGSKHIIVRFPNYEEWEMGFSFAEKGDLLVMPNKKKWKTNVSFVILVPKESNADCLIDILVIIEKPRFLIETESKELVIDMINKKLCQDTNNELAWFAEKTKLMLQLPVNGSHTDFGYDPNRPVCQD